MVESRAVKIFPKSFFYSGIENVVWKNQKSEEKRFVKKGEGD